MKTRIGVNGFGRIGRCIARIAAQSADVQLVAVNDIVEDLDNLIYLYNFDTTLGRAPHKAQRAPKAQGAMIRDDIVHFSNEPLIQDVPWENHEIDILVDATGVTSNVSGARLVVDAGHVKKVIISHSPDTGVDRYIIMGVNDDQYDPETDDIVSTTICDANGIAHILKFLDDTWGVANGFVTTLHPWLSYQNLVDGAVAWQASPGHFWTDYSLGRSSIGTIIPKNTTAVTALRTVLPEIEPRLQGFSFRIPTQTVCAADLSIRLENRVTFNQLKKALEAHFEGSPYVALSHEQLISADFEQRNESAIIDMRWLNVMADDMVKAILWYDNEWGYACRVVDLARRMTVNRMDVFDDQPAVVPTAGSGKSPG